MTDQAILELQKMRLEFANLVAHLSPWVSTHEMCNRYNCTAQTLCNMERRGEMAVFAVKAKPPTPAPPAPPQLSGA